MKRSNLLAVLCFLGLLLSSAPALADKPKVKGYYIDTEGKKTNVMIQMPTKMLSSKPETMQLNHFTYFDKRGKATELNAETAREFGFTYEGEDIVFRVLPKALQDVTHIKADFYKVLMEGACTIYLTYVSQGSFYSEYCLYKDEDHYYVTTTGITNRWASANGRINSMEELFSDCPDLVAKIKNKEFKKGDDKYFKIVEYYNQSCKAVEKTEE
jgi:hypothetical protein